ELTRTNHIKNKLKRTKYVACGIFQSSTEKLLSSKTQSCKRNLEVLILPNPAKRERIGCNFFCRCPWIYYLPDSESV
ncbi:Os05g0505692, partial [Oryza sativa Japonica Group]